MPMVLATYRYIHQRERPPPPREAPPEQHDKRTPESDPVLNNPYDAPREHWELDKRGRATGTLVKGRRASAPYPTVPVAGGKPRQPTEAENRMHGRINLIRKCVDAWRRAGYPGISPAIARLLRYWKSDEQSGMRPFFCQVDAIETLVWLCDATPSVDSNLPQLRTEIGDACKKYNGDILRYATKMATGTGKTVVMGMIAAWQAISNPGRTDILVMVPNLTVKDRLSVLEPSSDDNIYKDILPRSIKIPDDTKVTIMNYQAFQLRSNMEITPGEKADSKTRKIITAGAKEPDSWKESPTAMLDRRLPSHRGAPKIIVLNDEAHHCYNPDNPSAGGDGGEVVSPKEAALWFGTLTHLHEVGRLGMVFDMSATPMFISDANKPDTELFPWVVSDYPLIDAIEAGLTKIPRVPVNDLTGYDEPKYRNIYRYMRRDERKLRHDAMHDDVKDLLSRLEAKYKEEFERYAKDGRVPVMIVVAYPIENARAIYKHLAGYKDGLSWREGYHMFSNIKDGKPTPSPSTLLVTSEMDNLDDRSWADLAIDQQEFFMGGATKKGKIEHIRRVFKTVGQKEEPGENIRCIVSVNMLTEGWDVRTVTHIFGYRAFKSDLLCEQVAGRALRRSAMATLEKGELLPPEYAGIFGIPFSFMMGTGTPPEPTDMWEVRTEPGRDRYRMQFPNIRGYEIGSETTTLRLDSSKVKSYKTEKLTDKAGDVIVAGSAGRLDELKDMKRAHTAIFELAERITKRYAAHGTSRTPFFRSAVVAVHEWLKHPNVVCDDERLLAYNPNIETAATSVWEASVTSTARPPVIPVFANDGNPVHDRQLDTSGIKFFTTSKNRYPENGGIPAKSELNMAACDSAGEVEVARILDEHEGVEAWVRNHRLGWSIPYIEPKTGSYREYVPDFVARLSGGKSHLVIEYKGQETKDAQVKKHEVESKWIPAVNGSNDPACEGKWYYVYLDNEARIGTDLDGAIREGSS